MSQDITEKEHPIKIFIGSFCDIILLGILWAVTSLPLITIGAGTTAVYDVIGQIFRKEEGYILNCFWHSYKRNFKQATCLWLCFGTVFFLLILDLYLLYGRHNEGTHSFSGLIFGFLIFIFLEITYLFPLLSRFTNRSIALIKISFISAFRNFGRTILILILSLIVYYMIWKNPILILFIFGIYSFLIYTLLHPMMLQYENMIRQRKN